MFWYMDKHTRKTDKELTEKRKMCITRHMEPCSHRVWSNKVFCFVHPPKYVCWWCGKYFTISKRQGENPIHGKNCWYNSLVTCEEILLLGRAKGQDLEVDGDRLIGPRSRLSVIKSCSLELEVLVTFKNLFFCVSVIACNITFESCGKQMESLIW